MASVTKSVSSDTVNHDDTMRSDLLRLVVTPAVQRGEITVEVADQICSLFKSKLPPDYKLLMNEGISANKTPYYSKLTKCVITPRLAIEVGALFAKFPTVDQRVVDVTRNAALLSYVKAEMSVRDFEQSALDMLCKSPLFFKVRQQMRLLMSEFYPHEVVEELRFGPGSTSTSDVKLLSQKQAWLVRNNGVVLPSELYEYFANRGLLQVLAGKATAIARDFTHLTERVIPTPSVLFTHNQFAEEITTVPKDALTDRTISTFPAGVTLISVASNSVLSKAIHLADSRVEFVHQDRCSGFLDTYIDEWQDYKNTATIDLKDASGHVSWGLLTRLIDNSDVLELLRSLRAEFARFTIRVAARNTKTEPLLELRKVGSANSTTLSALLGVSEIKGETQEDSDVWERAIQENEWLRVLIDDGKTPVFHTVECHGKYHTVTVDVLRYSHAGMGSGVTFPIMAALIAAIIRAVRVSDYRVFGDDIILTNATPKDVTRVIQALEAFGLVVNRQKSCIGDNPIREAVGGWWHESGTVARFSPVYVRGDLRSLFYPPMVVTTKDGVESRKPGKCADLRVLHYTVMLHNYLVGLGKDDFAAYLARILAKNSAVPISRVPMSSGLFGLEVSDDDVWDWYAPVFKDGVLVSLRQRLFKNQPSYLNGTVNVERVSAIQVDHNVQVLYIKVKGISPAKFDKPTRGSFVDRDLTPMTRQFVQDQFFNSLGVLSDSCNEEDFRDWVRKANNIARTTEDRESSDRPEKDKQLFHQTTARLEIPYNVLIAWENQAQTT